MTDTATAPQNALAEEIVEAIRKHIADLTGRNWPEIVHILDKEGEVKLNFGTTINTRSAEAGNHADKDNRVKTTVSFSEKFSDSTESALEDPAQPMLPLDADDRLAGDIVNAVYNAEEQPTEQTQQRPPSDDTEGMTPMGKALHKAAAGKECPLLPIIISDQYTTERARMMFRKSAKKHGWPEACIDLLDDELLKVGDDMPRVIDILSAHTLTPSPKAEK